MIATKILFSQIPPNKQTDQTVKGPKSP